MKNILLTIAFLLFGLTVFCQTQILPVQGKLYDGGNPAGGNAAFTFSIPAISWSQNISTVVTDGLYAVELEVPSTLFASQNTHDLQIKVSLNGGSLTNLPSVKIHAPIEKDPTVPANLKDGVSWTEISNIPDSIDYDDTNELQTLELVGNELTITGGNTVQLGGSSSSGVFDTLCVGPAELDTVAVIEQLSNPLGALRDQVTQTFIPTCTGRLISIEVDFANIQTQGIFFKVTDINNSQMLTSGTFTSSAFSANQQLQPLTPQINIPFTLEKYKAYKLEIQVVGGGNYLFGYDNNQYLFGESNITTDGLADLKFRVNIEKTVGPSLKVNETGNVGIGTATPTSTLTVNGRIEDQTGFVMPVGSIMAWAGSSTAPTPKGWLRCDGSSVSRIEYADLYSVIETSWGNGDNSQEFRLPDLRGLFLRGAALGANVDPSVATRVAQYTGGAAGDNVGSYQLDAVADHRHWVARATNAGSAPLEGRVLAGEAESIATNISNGNPGVQPHAGDAWVYDLKGYNGDANAGASSGVIPLDVNGPETRPRNVYVLYIIKY